MTATKPQQQLDLVETSPSELIVVNARCVVEERDGVCVVVVSRVPVFQYHRDNHVDRSIFIAQAMAGGYASAPELAAALDVSLSTVYRYKRIFKEAGTSALIPKRPGPAKGQWLDEAERQAIRKWHAEGVTGREVATRLKHAPGTVQKAIRRMGLPPHRTQAKQQSLLGTETGSDDPEPAPPVAHEVDGAAPALTTSAPISAPPGPLSPSGWGRIRSTGAGIASWPARGCCWTRSPSSPWGRACRGSGPCSRSRSSSTRGCSRKPDTSSAAWARRSTGCGPACWSSS